MKPSRKHCCRRGVLKDSFYGYDEPFLLCLARRRKVKARFRELEKFVDSFSLSTKMRLMGGLERSDDVS